MLTCCTVCRRFYLLTPDLRLSRPPLLNMCRAMGIRTIQHKAHNARATGSVEKARDIIERKFEGGLRFLRVDDIDELNRLARLWRMKFNRTAIHSRHSMSRTDAAENYRRAAGKSPDPRNLQELAISAPEERTVTGKLRVPFRGKEYDVSDVPVYLSVTRCWLHAIHGQTRKPGLSLSMMKDLKPSTLFTRYRKMNSGSTAPAHR